MRAVAQQAWQSEVRGCRQKFKPAETALAVLGADYDCSRRAAIRRVQAHVATESDEGSNLNKGRW